MLDPDDFFRAAAVSIAEAQLAEQGSSQDELESKAKATAFMLCVKYGIDPGRLIVKMPRAAAQMEIKEIKAEFSEIRNAFAGIADRADESIRVQRKAGRERGHHDERYWLVRSVHRHPAWLHPGGLACASGRAVCRRRTCRVPGKQR